MVLNMAAVGGVGASGTVHHPAGPLVALAIMSRWRDTELRETVRDTWLADLDPATAQYRFFVERARLLRGNVTLGADGSDGEFVALSATRGGRWFNNTEQVRRRMSTVGLAAPVCARRVGTRRPDLCRAASRSSRCSSGCSSS